MHVVLRRSCRRFGSSPPPSYFSGKHHAQLVYKTISQQLRETAARHPDRQAVYSEHEQVRLTYAELLDRTEKMAAGLLGLGLAPQARVGVYAPTALDYYVVQLACSMADLVLVNINPAYRLHELEFALNKVGCAALLLVSQVKSTDYEALLHQLLPELASKGPGALHSQRVPTLRHLIKLDGRRASGFLTCDDVLAEGSQDGHLRRMREAEHGVQAEALTNIQFTSGTTGSPKASCLSHFNIMNNGRLLAAHCRYDHSDKILCSVPLYHCFGMVMCNLAALSVGAEVLYPHATFDAATSLRVASQQKATRLYGVPTMFLEMISRVERDPNAADLAAVRGGVMAGSICPRPLMEKAMTVLHCKELIIGYGMTETSPVTFMTAASDPLDKQVSTVGRAMPLTECKLVDAEGRVVPLGQKGEICTRGYMVMQGYWQDEKATRSSIDERGWMHTGDVGVFDEKGYLSIAGRIKDMINRGGEKVFPKEIEEYLLRHPKVLNAQVFAFPDERFGEEVFCWVKLKEGEQMDNQEVYAYCKEQIAHYKIPKYLKFVDDFPITVTGKPQKFRMTQSMVDEIRDCPSALDTYKLR